jgi:hypothetical protein
MRPILLSGTQTLVGTSLMIKVDGQLKPGDPVIGSQTISDIIKGDIKVSGTVTLQFQDETVSGLFDAETALVINAVLFADTTDTLTSSASPSRAPSCSRTTSTTARSSS